MNHHVELTEDDFAGVAHCELISKGWVHDEVNGQSRYYSPGSIGNQRLIWQDAVKVQIMIDNWGVK